MIFKKNKNYLKKINEYNLLSQLLLKKYIIFIIKFMIIAGFAIQLTFVLINLPVNFIDKNLYYYNVNYGATTDKVANDLYKLKLIRSKTAFKILAHFKYLNSKIKKGTYGLSPNMTLNEIISLLSEGKFVEQKVTIPEGFTVEQIAELLSKKQIIINKNKFLELAKTYVPYDYIKKSAKVKYQCEGFLFPDTYYFLEKSDPKIILTTLTYQFNKKFVPEMKAKAQKQNMSIYDIIVLASIIEREAKLKDERAKIAGVFINRINKKMLLQSCATVEYILQKHKNALSIKDIEIDSPYNTYINYGLPPGPISNPGLESIKSVLYPEKTDFLYYVINGKCGHYFAKTYAEHEKNITKLNL